MEQRATLGLEALITTAEAMRRESDGEPAEERFSWLAQRMLRRRPEQLWDLLKRASREDVDRIPELDSLLEELGRKLAAMGRLEEAESLIESARHWGVRLVGSVYQHLAEAFARSGQPGRAETVIRELLTRGPGEAGALRLLYRLIKDSGRTGEAHELLTRLVELDPSGATATFAYRERVHLGETDGRQVRIALLSSYVIEPLIPFLDVECRRSGLTPAFYAGPFNQYVQEIVEPSSRLYAFAPEIVFLALDLEDVLPAVHGTPSSEELAKGRDEIRSAVAKLVRELRSRCDALIVVHELALAGWSPHGILDNGRRDGLVPWVEDVNRDLAEELGAQTHTFLLPLRQVLARAGTEPGRSRKLRYMARMRHDEAALREVARYSMRYVKPLKGLTRKCVVVDLDGTLWGGVVGEVGAEGIQLGPTAPGVEFVDFQEALLNLTRRGILLAICSKNNMDDVLPIIREHKHMVLREEHFSALRVNWRNKAENLTAIAEELNIGLDALVFLDDNPAERALVRQLLPEVLTVELPRDASQFRSTLEDLTDFELLSLTREDGLRVSQYQANRRRQALERSTGSLEEYLRSLELRAEVARAEGYHVSRLVQMFNKTNQFNTTTRRYQVQEVERVVGSPEHRVYVLEVTDRFGDHGIVGAASVAEGRDEWCIDSLLLSCRVMGLAMETVLLKRICDAARVSAVPRLLGRFIRTAKNGPTADFYERHGFRLEKDTDGVQVWTLDPQVDGVEDPVWVVVKAGGE